MKLDFEKGFSVKCNTEKEVKEVLEICESLGFRWRSGHAPTKFTIESPYYPMFLAIKNKIIVHSHYRDFKSEYSANEFINSFTGLEINITRKGNVVHAVMNENGKVVKRTKATCSPEDTFNLRTGVKLAIDRLFAREKQTFKVGDRVKIRQWEDMIGEFGVDFNDDIKCYLDFTTSMRVLCGESATVEKIDKHERGEKVWLKFDNTEIPSENWIYSTDMIEHCPEYKLVKDEIKVICTKSDNSYFTKGKVYKANDFRIFDNFNSVWFINTNTSVETYKDSLPFDVDFIELVE